MLIIGSGSFLADLLTTICIDFTTEELVIYNDVNMPYPDFVSNDFRILKNDDEVINYFEQEDDRFVVAIGNNVNREKVSNKFTSLGGKNVSFISSGALVGKYADISPVGVIITAHACITNGVTVSEGTIIYAFSGIGHFSKIGKYCLLSSNVIMSDTSIGDYCDIGIGVSFVPGKSIGSNCKVGTGSVITKSYGNDLILAGNPAKIFHQ